MLRRLLQLYDLLEQTQEHAFHILQDERQFHSTACFQRQRKILLATSSARNQFFGKVLSQHIVDSRCIVAVNIQDFSPSITCFDHATQCWTSKTHYWKEVMVMFKAPWVKVSATIRRKKQPFQATILSMQNEEAILQIKGQLNWILCEHS